MNTINWDDFKCRCSGISKIMANKQGFEPLTELQETKVLELEDKEKNGKMTDKQRDELIRLIAKRKQEEAFIVRQADLNRMGVQYVDGNFVLNGVSYEAVLVKESDDEVWGTIRDKFNEQHLINEESRLAEEKRKAEEAKEESIVYSSSYSERLV